MPRIASLFALAAALLAAPAVHGQRAQAFGEHVVHFNAYTADQLEPQVARAYGIRRSSSRAVVNLTVLRKASDAPGTPVRARVSAAATNLVGQRRDIEMREISEPGGAVYYLGEFPVRNMETWRFRIEVRPEDGGEPLNVRFEQQFYTE